MYAVMNIQGHRVIVYRCIATDTYGHLRARSTES